MWIQLLAPRTIEIQGKNIRYSPGDWVEVGKQTALLWLSDGSAQIPKILDSGFDFKDCGILTDHKELLCTRLKEELKSIEVLEGAACLPFKKTIIMDSSLPLRTSLIPVGLSILDTFEIAVPLSDYKILAAHIGTEQEREETKAVIRDLRVPVYNTQLMFVKQTPDTEWLIENWRNSGQTQLAFLRELYRVKPLILALPCTWTSAAPVRND